MQVEIYSTEEQQVDAIKQFWKDYGTSIVVGAVVGPLVVYMVGILILT